MWKANFFRMDMPAGKPQAGSAWSPPMAPDFHVLDKFGEIIFGDDKGSAPAPMASPVAPSAPAPSGPAPAVPVPGAPLKPGVPAGVVEKSAGKAAK